MAKHKEAKRSYFLTGTVFKIKTHNSMVELSIDHDGREPHQWVAVKLFKAAQTWATGLALDTSDPYADPSTLVWSELPVVKKNDVISVRTLSAPKDGPVFDGPPEKKIRRMASDGKPVVKRTFCINSRSELKVIEPTE